MVCHGPLKTILSTGGSRSPGYALAGKVINSRHSTIGCARSQSLAAGPGIADTEALQQNFGESASLSPSPDERVEVAAPYISNNKPRDNGKAFSVPGMTAFHG
ncbi:MAG TPA: hypothetical protein EYP14_20880 [Planctomycetaceae bacterium]|nr:hypothetical protein [Planctomycetaceae bacterium]